MRIFSVLFAFEQLFASLYLFRRYDLANPYIELCKLIHVYCHVISHAITRYRQEKP
jgi:hypothetical protein